MHEYHEIKLEVSQILTANGYIEEEENLSPDFYGSMYSIFIHDKKRVYIGWDGKNGFGIVKVWIDEKWVKLKPPLIETSRDFFTENLKALSHKLKAYIE